MERAVEAHVLHKVRKPALVFVFVHRTCLDDEPKLGARLRQPVRADVIPEAVGKRADGNERIDRNGLVEGGASKVDGRCGCWAFPKLTTDATASTGSSRRRRVRKVMSYCLSNSLVMASLTL